MANILDEFMKTLGPQVTKEMASKMKFDPRTAQKIIPQILPLILGGLKRQKENHGGQARVDHILNKYGKASNLDDISGLFSRGVKNKNPDPALGGLLGDSGFEAVNLLTKQFNLKGSQIKQLIPVLAPLILGMLTKKRDAGKVGSTGIGRLLDQDGDGSILDDVAGFLLKGQGSQSSRGGLLGGLLGGLFKRRN